MLCLPFAKALGQKRIFERADYIDKEAQMSCRNINSGILSLYLA
jgi:hypothetical protein